MGKTGLRTILGISLVPVIGFALAVSVGTAQSPKSQGTKATQQKVQQAPEQKVQKKGTEPQGLQPSKPKLGQADQMRCDPDTNPDCPPGGCVAPVEVKVEAPKVGLSMKTQQPAVWYSLVDTIPPVGHTASVTVKPVRLLSMGREVGTLEVGIVKFREVVRDVPLNGSASQNDQKVATLISELKTTTEKQLAQLTPITVERFVIPGPGVQVMRARLEETYSIDGIGRDKVELNGWIAVRHGQPRATGGATEINWNTAVLDTEFVGMNLKGDSDVFGPMTITLDTTRPSRGQVGRIELPELARVALVAELKKHQLAEQAQPAAKPSAGSQQQR